jgi:hypothetical protein
MMGSPTNWQLHVCEDDPNTEAVPHPRSFLSLYFLLLGAATALKNARRPCSCGTPQSEVLASSEAAGGPKGRQCCRLRTQLPGSRCRAQHKTAGEGCFACGRQLRNQMEPMHRHRGCNGTV